MDMHRHARRGYRDSSRQIDVEYVLSAETIIELLIVSPVFLPGRNRPGFFHQIGPEKSHDISWQTRHIWRRREISDQLAVLTLTQRVQLVNHPS